MLDGWKTLARVILLGVIMDVIYQMMVLRRVYPMELVIVVLLLVFVPYLIVRGPANRLARHWRRKTQA